MANRRSVQPTISSFLSTVQQLLFRAKIDALICALFASANFHPGARVKTLRGSMSGRILRVLSDGRVVWQTDSGAELTALPEALLKEKKNSSQPMSIGSNVLIQFCGKENQGMRNDPTHVGCILTLLQTERRPVVGLTVNEASNGRNKSAA